MEKIPGEREFYRGYINRMLEEASAEEVKTVYYFVLNYLS